MRLHFLAILGVLLAVMACVPIENDAAELQPFRADFILSNVHVINPGTGTITYDQAIAVREGVIVDTGPIDLLSHLAGAEFVDGRGAYVTPGLWDSHVHTLNSVSMATERNFPAFIAYGITHIRDLGSNFERLIEIKQWLDDNPAAVAPHLIASGPIMMQAELRWYQGIQRAIGEPGTARQAVAEFHAAGFDLMKAYTGLEQPAYHELMDAAQQAGMPVDGHVPESMGLVGVVDAGQRTIEHLDMSSFITCGTSKDRDFSGYLGVRFSEGLSAYVELANDFWSHIDWSECGPALQALSARGGALTPTLSMEIRDRSRNRSDMLDRLEPLAMEWCETHLAQFDAVDPDLRETYFAILYSVVRRLNADGVRLLAGTDTQNFCLIPAVSLSGELNR
jgi:imidazolonepropionase-like amidohydrolase